MGRDIQRFYLNIEFLLGDKWRGLHKECFRDLDWIASLSSEAGWDRNEDDLEFS